MKADKNKLELAMANACMNPEDLELAANMPRPTLDNLISGRNVRPRTIGLVAKALNCNVEDILLSDQDEN